MSKIRVIFAEDEGTFRAALAEVLGAERDLEIIKAVGNGRDALIESLALHPDVVLTDLQMPQMDGIALTRAIREQLPQTAVVILTMLDDDENLFAAIKAGALGYILKNAHPSQVADAIRAAHAGDGFLSAGLVARVLQEFARIDRLVRRGRELFRQLTRREVEVLELLAGGLRNRQIAQRLGLAEKTVRNHISEILGKLQANDRTEVALLAARHGLGPPPAQPQL